MLKGCFGAEPFSHAGEHFTITGYDARPKPVQRPHPPFFIGGGGRRLLRYAAREADIVGFAPRLLSGAADPTPDLRSMTLAATAEKLDWVREAAGDRFDRLELNIYPSTFPVAVTGDPRGAIAERADRLRGLTGSDVTDDELLESPHVFVGTVDSLTEKLLGLRERFGISSVMVGDIDTLAPVVERLAGR